MKYLKQMLGILPAVLIVTTLTAADRPDGTNLKGQKCLTKGTTRTGQCVLIRPSECSGQINETEYDGCTWCQPGKIDGEPPDQCYSYDTPANCKKRIRIAGCVPVGDQICTSFSFSPWTDWIDVNEKSCE